jgi:WD40 repeat protein
VTLWDPTGLGAKPLTEWQANDDEVYALVVMSDGTTIAASGGRREVARERFSEPYEPDRSIWLGNLTGQPEPRRLLASNVEGTRHGGAVNTLAFSPDQRWLASGSSDATVRLWSMTGSDEVRIMEGHTGAVGALAFSRDGTILASTGTDQTVRLWRMDRPTGPPTTNDVLNPPGPQPPAQPNSYGR